MSRQTLILIPLLLVAAVVAAWMMMAGVDTGPEVADARPVVPPVARVEPPPADPMPGRPAAIPGAVPVPNSFIQPGMRPGIDAANLKANAGLDDFGKELDLPEDPEQRAIVAAVRTTERRVSMMAQMFRMAPMVVPDGPDRQAVREVLDGALEEMRGIQGKVEHGLSYRDASGYMDEIRDNAAARIDSILPPAESEAVQLRMGMKPPTPPDEVFEWEGVPVEEAFGEWK